MSIQQNKIKAIIQKIWSLLPNPQPMSGDDIVDKSGFTAVQKTGQHIDGIDLFVLTHAYTSNSALSALSSSLLPMTHRRPV